MTIYIVSYVSYDDDGSYLYTESKPFKDFESAKTAQMRYVQDARKEFEDMIDVDNENETAIWENLTTAITTNLSAMIPTSKSS